MLVVEAGTGTGKTYAYLLPALLSGHKVIVSTGTRPLQDQLYHRDLPLLLHHLGIPCKRALLKGRSNYLCTNRLAQADVPFADKMQQQQLKRIQQWAKSTSTGDFAELADLPENAPIFAKVCGNVDFCVDNIACKAGKCFVQNARKRAQEADIVVVNHHLLLADMALKSRGKGELLPKAAAYICDEAHQLPAIASDFFGSTLSSSQLLDFCKLATLNQKLLEEQARQAAQNCINQIENAVRQLRLLFGSQERRELWQSAHNERALKTMQGLMADLTALAECFAPLEDLYKKEDADSPYASVPAIIANCHDFAAALGGFLKADADIIYWLHIGRNHFSLQQTPLDVAKLFRASMQTLQGTWIFTSATLTVNGSFAHFIHDLGLMAPRTLLLESPFDYANNSMLMLPPDLPEPQSAGFYDALIQITVPLLKAAKGRAFLLFTSYKALNLVAEKIAKLIDMPLFIQGSAPRSQLLDDFRDSGNGVLLGTSSFWEGVDIKGRALSLVIIDKLPFAAPNDPVLAARLDAIQKKGGNPFMQMQIPNAVISLKQGVGRLIRDGNDKGVVVICDVRLKTKFYGKSFSNSLPPMRRTRNMARVMDFLSKI